LKVSFLKKIQIKLIRLYLSLIIFIFCNGSSIGWVAVALADAYSMGWVVVAVSAAAAVAVMAVQNAVMPLPFDGWWRRWWSKWVAVAVFVAAAMQWWQSKMLECLFPIRWVVVAVAVRKVLHRHLLIGV
jgi:hypothetical protein